MLVPRYRRRRRQRPRGLRECRSGRRSDACRPIWRSHRGVRSSDQWTDDAIGGALALPVRTIKKLRLLAHIHPAMLDYIAKGDMPKEEHLPDNLRRKRGRASLGLEELQSQEKRTAQRFMVGNRPRVGKTPHLTPRLRNSKRQRRTGLRDPMGRRPIFTKQTKTRATRQMSRASSLHRQPGWKPPFRRTAGTCFHRRLWQPEAAAKSGTRLGHQEKSDAIGRSVRSVNGEIDEIISACLNRIRKRTKAADHQRRDRRNACDARKTAARE